MLCHALRQSRHNILAEAEIQQRPAFLRAHSLAGQAGCKAGRRRKLCLFGRPL
jgi:hypothetical protein